LDITSLKNDNILLLDTYFKIIIWEGPTIQSWRDQGYDKDPDYENVALCINSPREDA
jgi:protein transport protein SEC23